MVEDRASEFGDMGIQKFGEADQYETDMSGSFIVDIDNISPSSFKDGHSANSRISVMLHRNLSRNESIKSASSRSTDGSPTGGSCGPDMSTPVTVACMELKEPNEQPHQTITITTEHKGGSKMSGYLKNRASFINPRRVLFFFATLSSMGTIVLIYFTLSVSKLTGDSYS